MIKGSVAALITPFNPSGEVDFPAFRNLVQWHIEEKTDGLVVCGTTGEAPTLSEEEQLELLRIAVKEAKGRIPVIMGTGTNDTKSSIINTELAMQNGADGCLVIFPYYSRPTFEGCLEHVRRIAKVGLPVILYHHPGRTGIRFNAPQLAEFCQIPGIVGIKETSGDTELAAELMRICPTTVLTGDDTLTLPIIALGGKGVISVVANAIPREWREFVHTCLSGNFALARQQMDRLAPLCKALALETNPQCIKYAVSLLKRAEPYLRLPLIQPKDPVKEQIAKALHGIVWEKKVEAKEVFVNVL